MLPVGTAARPWTLGGAACVAVILGRSATRCYKRRQSEGFFAENTDFLLRLPTFVTEVLARRFESCWFDDVCNVGRPLVARPGPAAGHGYRIWVL